MVKPLEVYCVSGIFGVKRPICQLKNVGIRHLSEVVRIEGSKHDQPQDSELPIMAPLNWALNLKRLYALPPKTLLDLLDQQSHLFKLVLVEEVLLCPGRLPVLHSISAAEVAPSFLPLPSLKCSEDGHAVAEAAISPVQLALVRLHPFIERCRENWLPTQPSCNYNSFLQNPKYVAKHSQLAKPHIQR